MVHFRVLCRATNDDERESIGDDSSTIYDRRNQRELIASMDTLVGGTRLVRGSHNFNCNVLLLGL